MALVVVAAGVAAAVALIETAHSTPACTLSPPAALSQDSADLLEPCGAGLTLKPHSFQSYTMVRFSDQMIVEGQLSVTGPANTSFGAYLLNSSEFSELLADPDPQALPSDYFWSSSPGPSINLSVSVPGSPAQFYLALVNAGPTAIPLEWPHGLVLYYRAT